MSNQMNDKPDSARLRTESDESQPRNLMQAHPADVPIKRMGPADAHERGYRANARQVDVSENRTMHDSGMDAIAQAKVQ